MFRLSFHAVNSPARRLLPEEEEQHSIASRHADHLEEAIEEDRRLQATTDPDMEVTVHHHLPDVGRLHDDTEDDRGQESVISTRIGHAHIHDQGHHEGRGLGHFHQGLEVEPHLDGTEVEHVGRARRRQEGEGEGALVTRAILATATAAVVGAEADTGGAGDDGVLARLCVGYESTASDRDVAVCWERQGCVGIFLYPWEVRRNELPIVGVCGGAKRKATMWVVGNTVN